MMNDKQVRTGRNAPPRQLPLHPVVSPIKRDVSIGMNMGGTSCIYVKGWLA